MVLSNGEVVPDAGAFADADRFVFLGPDAALLRCSPASRRPEPSGPRPEPWMVELYEDNDEVVRVLIVGDEA